MEQSLIDPEVQKVYEEVVPKSWFDADPNYIVKVGARRHEQFLGEADARLALLMEGCTDPVLCRRRGRRVALDEALLNEEWLHGETGLGHAMFFYIVACFEHEVRTSLDVPLFRNGVDPERASDRGNRCSLASEHMVCMFMHHAWTGCAQESLQGVYGIDQTTASRNIRLVRGILANSDILPTDMVLTDELKSMTPRKSEAAVGGVINFDWTHYVIEGPADKESNEEAYSHKAGATTAKSLYGCCARGWVITSGGLEGGRGSEIEYLRHRLPDMGHVTASLTDPNTPPGSRITANLDGGPQAADKVLQGANVRMPYRKPPKGELTDEQNAYNSRLAADRSPIENRFAEAKQHGILANKFRGSVRDLHEYSTVAFGIVNLKLMMREADGFVPDTHADEAKGPGPPGPHGRKPRQTFDYLRK